MHAAGGVHEHALTLIREHTEPGAAVLDAGCGVGALAQRLADAGYEVTAADVDVDDYRAEPPAIAWDVTKDPPAVTVDAVCAIEVLEHVQDPIAAIGNLRTVLRPGGILVLSTPNVGHVRSRIKFLLRGAPSYFGAAEYHTTGHRTLLPDWLLIKHLEAEGLAIVAVSYAGELGLEGLGRYPWAALRRMLRLLGRMRVEGDGAATFVVARRSVGSIEEPAPA